MCTQCGSRDVVVKGEAYCATWANWTYVAWHYSILEDLKQWRISFCPGCTAQTVREAKKSGRREVCQELGCAILFIIVFPIYFFGEDPNGALDRLFRAVLYIVFFPYHVIRAYLPFEKRLAGFGQSAGRLRRREQKAIVTHEAERILACIADRRVDRFHGTFYLPVARYGVHKGDLKRDSLKPSCEIVDSAFIQKLVDEMMQCARIHTDWVNGESGQHFRRVLRNALDLLSRVRPRHRKIRRWRATVEKWDQAGSVSA